MSAVSDASLQVRTASDVTRIAKAMYGTADPQDGVTHVASVVKHGGEYHVMRIDEDAPSSAHDKFALGFVRAGADAIVTTGEILRREPGLRLDRFGTPRQHDALAEWRNDILGLPEKPIALLLSSGRDLPLQHEFFEGEGDIIVFTSDTAPVEFVDRARDRGLRVYKVTRPGIRSALSLLREDYQCSSISVEAGPTTSGKLYDAPLTVNRVFLSIFHGSVERVSFAGKFLAPNTLSDSFARYEPPYEVAGPSGNWTFLRLDRRTPIASLT